jgi:hypothetical protein
MNIRAIVLRSLLSVAVAVALPAQAPSWSTDYAAAGLGGRVFAFADHLGELYAGGNWFAAKGGPIRGIARFDGVAWRPVSTGIDLISGSLPIAEPHVRAFAEFNGELVFAGTFNLAGGQAIHNIARWDGTSLRPLGTGLDLSFGDAEVRGLAVFNSELYAAGYFDRADGQPTNSIARWDGTNWHAVGNGLTYSTTAGVAYPRALLVHNNQLVVGGDFTRAGTVNAINTAVWNGTAWSAVGGSPMTPVYALASYGGALVAAAQFQIGAAVEMLAQWNGTQWTSLGSGGPDLPITALATLGTMLYAGGQFVNPGPYMARFDGTSWANVGGVNGVFSGITLPTVYALCPRGTDLVVGGEFVTAGVAPGRNGAVATANVAVFDGGTGWHQLGDGLGLDRPAQRILQWHGSRIAVGYFTETGTVRAVGVSRFDGDRWNLLGDFDGGVSDAEVHQGNLVVTGAFTHIDGVAFPGVAMHDGTQWRAFGPHAPPGLHAHAGQLYGYGGSGLQQWNGSTFATVALPTSIVSQLHSHGDGLLYLATDNAFQHEIHSFDGSQTQLIGTANDFLHALGSHGADLVVGGRFTAVSGIAANLMARWDGAAWHAMAAPVSGYAVQAFAELDGVLHAAVNGDPRGFCLALRGNSWQALGAGVDGVPHTMFVDRAVASLLVSGDILTAGGTPTRSLAEWRTQPAWRNLQHGTPGQAEEPLLLGRGALTANTTATFAVETLANTPALFVFGARRLDQTLFGGTLVPAAHAIVFALTDGLGGATLALTVPAGFPPGVDVFSQVAVLDASGPQGVTASNALQCTSH